MVDFSIVITKRNLENTLGTEKFGYIWIQNTTDRKYQYPHYKFFFVKSHDKKFSNLDSSVILDGSCLKFYNILCKHEEALRVKLLSRQRNTVWKCVRLTVV